MTEAKLRRKSGHKRSSIGGTATTNLKTRRPKKESNNRLLWLMIALFWPLILRSFLGGLSKGDVQKMKEMNLQKMKERVQTLLSRKDLAGYGPRFPRLVVLVTGENVESMREAVESVFEHTDRNRILTVVAVVDGALETTSLIEKFESIDKGETPHWHGMRYDKGNEEKDQTENEGDDSDDENGMHGKKIHVIFNKQKQGAAKSRQIGAIFARELAEKHEKAQLKLKEEELILLLMRQDARFKDSNWLDPLTAALILPELSHKIYKTSLANAVSFYPKSDFNLYDGKHDLALDRYTYMVPSFDFAFDGSHDKAITHEREPYATPALHGYLTAMRLTTFLSLPARDETLSTYFAADIELALNLWLCADGIDVLPQSSISYSSTASPSNEDHTTETASRLAAAWMDETYLNVFYDAKANAETTKTSMKQFVKDAKKSPTFPIDLQTRCRSYSWYVKKFHTDSDPFRKKSDRVIPIKTSNVDADTPKKKSNIMKIETSEKNRRLDNRKLTPDKLNLLKTAKPIDLAFVDASQEESHFEALDENGEKGYKYDPTTLHINPPKYKFNKHDSCGIHDGNNEMLTKKVMVNPDALFKAEEGKDNKTKIFCSIYTIEKNHHKLPTIRETWGQRCDGFMVASDKTDPELNTIEIPHEGPEEYGNIWQKNRAIWAYVYDNYYNDYDWFHIGGDDMYIIVENLRTYVESDEIKLAVKGGSADKKIPEGSEVPLFLGRRFAEQGNMNRIFNSGGSGYTLNKAALKLLVTVAFPRCFVHMQTFAEDVMVAQCLRDQGVFPYETKDEFGGERYMPFAPGHHYNYRLPKDIVHSKDWYVRYSIDIKEGLDHCSKDSIAFHYIDPKLMSRMHALLYNFCE